MDFWRETVVVVPDGGMCKATTPASSNRVRHTGERVPAAVLVPVSIWFIVIMLKPATYTSQKHSHIFLWSLMVPHRLFWQRQITLPALTGHTVLRTWRCSSRTPTLRDGMCKATTPVVKERCVTSQWRQVGDVARFGGDFERILS